MLADLILVVWGEAENCCFEEKKWVAHVVLNRLKKPNKFRSIEEDFKGYTRPLKITNKLERRAFKECVEASLSALYETKLNIDPTDGAVFFALKDNIDYSKAFRVDVEMVETPKNFKHYFFKLR
ncbi:MAG: hypothetical protein ACP6IS_12465 [Candidatus Asgardarchaeia archaeon]